MSDKLDMDDWLLHHVQAAAAQGWCLSEVGISSSPHCVEIQRIDDAELSGHVLHVQVPQLQSDDDAVQALKAAWLRGEDHAGLAYQLLKTHSPSEFEFWQMMTWHR